MKNTKKIITLALAAAMLSATGITAFAETTNVSYDVQPTYTVTIPATVNLGDNDVTANIEASDVLLETGKQIKVDLTAASNTQEGSTFNAKNGNSAVTYTITGDKAIAVGDTVATFTANGSKTLTFSAADKSAATVAGAHTETLTFGVAVEDAAKYNVHVSASYSVDSMFEGEPDQIGLTGAMEPVTVRIPDDYKTIFRFNKFDDIVQNGITKHWVDDYTVTVSGTPTADTNVFVRLDMID